MLFFIEVDSITFTIPYHILCQIQWFFFLIYKSKKPFFFSFSSWLIKVSVLHTSLMKLLPIYKNILRVHATVISLFYLVKPLKSLKTERMFKLKPVFCIYSFFFVQMELSVIISKHLKITSSHTIPWQGMCVLFTFF